MQLEHDHSIEGIRTRLASGNSPNYLRDWVYGGIDGAITTFAIVAGVLGAGLSANIILILGLANLLADGFSMAASNYTGTKTEVDELDRYREIEKRHIRQDPEGEREEVRQILQGKGLEGPALDDAVKAVTSSEETWINTMLVDEYGLATNLRSPLKSGLATMASFVLFGAIPLAPFLLGLADAVTVALAMTLAAFFLIGTIKSRWSLATWWQSGLETLAIGLAASALAYGVGYLVKDLAA
ncbi:VIT1/CCC1 transporter family protein [Anderseniella sp. Alg231-50]|uniref:VIT1/CCC1 transporter family protein n=1 Tax=Anderseniella sp. Alg231-50 TaxID=1922226 RepID=UPI000D55EFA9